MMLSWSCVATQEPAQDEAATEAAPAAEPSEESAALQSTEGEQQLSSCTDLGRVRCTTTAYCDLVYPGCGYHCDVYCRP